MSGNGLIFGGKAKRRSTTWASTVSVRCNLQFKHVDTRAFLIARSTQLHNPAALKTIDDAGQQKVADWLRTR